MDKSMNFGHDLGLLLQENSIGVDLSPKGKDLCTTSLRLFQIIDGNFTNIGFEDIDSDIILGLESLYDGLYLLMDGFFNASIGKSEDDIEVALVDSNIDQELIDILFVIG